MVSSELFTREEALGGLPARRARFLLFLIEGRTARRAAREGEIPSLLLAPEIGVWRPELLAGDLPAGYPLAGERPPGDTEAEENDGLAPFRHAAEPPAAVTIQQIERYARDWAPLVPDNARLRAAVARLLGEKYRLVFRSAPGIRAALGLDRGAVQAAYEELSGVPLASIYTAEVTAGERLRWAMAALGRWLDGLPPFWFTFAFIFALGIPQAILALPIAAAAVGALPGVALVLLGGLLSLVTVTGMAEAAARSGAVRYGAAYAGKLVSDYLGRAGSASFTPFLMGLYLLAILASFEGLSLTLAHFTPVPAGVWTALLFAAGLYALARGSVRFSFGASVSLAGLVLGLLGLVALLSIGHLHPANWLRAPQWAAGRRPPGLENVFGVVLMGYISEAFVIQCAKAVLPRDPSGRSLIGGSVAGLAAIALLLCGWVLLINGVLPPEALLNERGTIFIPLAARIGPAVAVIGSVLSSLLLGLVALRCMIGSFNAVREWLPSRPRLVLQLPREHARLLLRCRGAAAALPLGAGRPGIGLAYLGRAGEAARFRVDIQSGGAVRHVEMAVAGRWDAAELFAAFPELRRDRLQFTLEILAAGDEEVRLLISAAPGVISEVERDRAGLRLPDLVSLPADEWRLLSGLVRQGEASVAEVAAAAGQTTTATQEQLTALVRKGLLQQVDGAGGCRYRTQFAARRPRRLPDSIWQALEGEGEGPGARGQGPDARGQGLVHGGRGGPRVSPGARASSLLLANSTWVPAGLPECGLQAAHPPSVGTRAAEQPDMRPEVRTPAGPRRLSANSPAVSSSPAKACGRGGGAQRGAGPRARSQGQPWVDFGRRVLATDAWRLIADSFFSERGRFWLSVSPLVAVFLLTEWRLLTGRGSFAGALGLLGVLINVYATGVIPLLLLLACHRKGEVVPGTVLRFLGHPILVGGLYLLYLAILLFHALVLWQAPWARAAGLFTAALTVVVTLIMARRRAFAPRAVVELREDLRDGGQSAFSVMAAGHPLPVAVRLDYAEGEPAPGARVQVSAAGEVPAFARLRSLTFTLPPAAAPELKVWAHRVTPGGDSEPLPGLAAVQCGAESHEVDLGLCRGQVLLPLARGACEVRIMLSGS